MNSTWSLPAEWLADMAETLEYFDAPLTPGRLADLVCELAEDRDRWRGRTGSAPWVAGAAEAADAAEALGEEREDCASRVLTWTQIIHAIHELREDRDHWKGRAERAESAECALEPYLCPKCSTCISPQEMEMGHTMCRKCAKWLEVEP